ncbi:unnamed protein product [Rotaria socialis]|uniref:Tudor domain-containing protein n=1 Tax=Rotaria socialis TaxID=392032 RepID=A0A820LB80_9BILA|nr:unnamed protein product [Rotaria socialis]CAF4356752.1 unnamed protein product [Rotaria socialis]
MASTILAIVEYGAQKQRMSLDPHSSYQDICNQIYSLFKLDPINSKYSLQRQDSLKFGSFINIDERTFQNELKQYAIKNKQNPVLRLRLTPAISKNTSKPVNGVLNGEKAWSTSSSQCQHDESDRASTNSAATIDIKQLIRKCLTNLKETTENIQLLDRYFHPEDYIDDECQLTNKSSTNIQQAALPVNTSMNREILQAASISESRITTSNIIDELIPGLNHLMSTQQTLLSASSLITTDKPVESSPIPPQTTVNYHTQAPVNNQILTSVPNSTNVQTRSSNKSFSNRLGVMIQPNQTQNSVVQEPKSVSPCHQYIPQKTKSPCIVKQSIVMSHEKHQNEISSHTIVPPPPPSPPPQPPKLKYKIELKQYEFGAALEGIVSVASNASYFFLQLIDERKDEFDHLSKSLHEYYSNLDKNSNYRPSPGDYCVAMYTEDARWYRARIIRYISDQTCEVFYVDYGNMEELPIEFLHEILPDFVRLPARSIACTITEILPPIGQEGWTKRATFAFASRCSNERVQATVVESTNMKWPMHLVQLRVSKTQEDIGTSLETCKLARHVSNHEICDFWSNKIRLEQYILYNLPEPNPDRFPFIEQGTSSYFHYMTTNPIPVKNEKEQHPNPFLSSSLQRTPSTDRSTKEETTPALEEVKPLQENNNQTTSSIISNNEPNEIELNKQSTLDVSQEKKEEHEQFDGTTTPSSSLNPDATPFVIFSTSKTDTNQSTSTGNESDDEIDSNETPAMSDSSERPRMPIKEEVIVDTNLTPSTPLLKSWLPIEVTHIETPTRFYIRYIYGPSWNLGNGSTPELTNKKEEPEKNVVLKELTQEMTLCYSKHKRICPGDSYDEGELVAVKFRSQWHRGRFIQYKPNIDFAHIFFVDYGYTRSVPISMIRPINNRFVLHAEQAHLVHLHQPDQRRGRKEWDTKVIEEFQEMTKDGTNLYSRIVSEANTIELMSYDPLTKKWFSFYEHFVKHLNHCDNIELSS